MFKYNVTSLNVINRVMKKIKSGDLTKRDIFRGFLYDRFYDDDIRRLVNEIEKDRGEFIIHNICIFSNYSIIKHYILFFKITLKINKMDDVKKYCIISNIIWLKKLLKLLKMKELVCKNVL